MFKISVGAYLLFSAAAGLLACALPAHAGRYVCPEGEHLSEDQRRCSQGSIPQFIADEIAPSTSKTLEHHDSPPVAGAKVAKPAKAGASQQSGSKRATGELPAYFGVWRTSVPGAVWTSPSGYRGYDWLNVSAGVSAGDLIIRPDGTYVWNSYGGKSGRWVRGDADYPIVLIDTAENKKWKVALDPQHVGGRDLIVWDGNAYTYNGRK